jgi:hypothetical protein
MPIFLIPVAILAAIKAYFVYHGASIATAAIKAGYKAHRNGDDVAEAAIEAGASKAAACLLEDWFRRYA